MSGPEVSAIDSARQLASRAGLFLIAALFIAGLGLWAAGAAGYSTRVLLAACGLLVAMPIVALLAALAEEVRRRDWPFVCAAGVVVLLVAYSIAVRLG